MASWIAVSEGALQPYRDAQGVIGACARRGKLPTAKRLRSGAGWWERPSRGRRTWSGRALLTAAVPGARSGAAPPGRARVTGAMHAYQEGLPWRAVKNATPASTPGGPMPTLSPGGCDGPSSRATGRRGLVSYLPITHSGAALTATSQHQGQTVLLRGTPTQSQQRSFGSPGLRRW